MTFFVGYSAVMQTHAHTIPILTGAVHLRLRPERWLNGVSGLHHDAELVGSNPGKNLDVFKAQFSNKL